VITAHDPTSADHAYVCKTTNVGKWWTRDDAFCFIPELRVQLIFLIPSFTLLDVRCFAPSYVVVLEVAVCRSSRLLVREMHMTHMNNLLVGVV
jgi:hypothetical protein